MRSFSTSFSASARPALLWRCPSDTRQSPLGWEMPPNRPHCRPPHPLFPSQLRSLSYRRHRPRCFWPFYPFESRPVKYMGSLRKNRLKNRVTIILSWLKRGHFRQTKIWIISSSAWNEDFILHVSFRVHIWFWFIFHSKYDSGSESEFQISPNFEKNTGN